MQKNLEIDQLAAVHVTSYEPHIDEEGRLLIQTTFDALGGMEQSPEEFAFRNTIHTSMNGVVSSHMFGNWDDKPFVVIAPIQNILDNNGAPAGFALNDTYWAFDEGTPMALTDYFLVRAVDEESLDDRLIAQQGNSIHFRTEYDDDSRYEFLTKYLTTDFYQKYIPEQAAESWRQFVFAVDNVGDKSFFPEDVSVATAADQEELVKRVMGATPEQLEVIDKVMFMHLRDQAVSRALEECSVEMHAVNHHGWIDGQNIDVGDFAEEQGWQWGKHFYSAENKLCRMINGEAEFGVMPRASADEIYEFIEAHSDQLTEQTKGLVKQVADSDVYAEARVIYNGELERIRSKAREAQCT